MDSAITITFWIMAGVTLVYMSHAACMYYDKIWHSPFDIVRYWKMCKKTGNIFQKIIFYINIVSLIIAIVLSITILT